MAPLMDLGVRLGITNRALSAIIFSSFLFTVLFDIPVLPGYKVVRFRRVALDARDQFQVFLAQGEGAQRKMYLAMDKIVKV